MRYFCTILLFLLFTPPLYAQNSYSEFERGLNLSDSQRSQVEGIRNRYIDEWRALKQESIQKRLEMRELRRERSNNGGREDMLRSEIRSIEQSRENLFNRYRSEVSRVLNPEQKSRYDNFSDMERRRNMHPSRLREHGR
jgi:Spy/CpxP family protein refolding chaperone